MLLNPTNDRPGEPDEFSGCTDAAEVFIATNALLGLAGVERLLAMNLAMTRQGLREAAGELQKAGMLDLAKLVRSHIRRAKSAPETFNQRWDVEARRDGTRRGHQGGKYHW